MKPQKVVFWRYSCLAFLIHKQKEGEEKKNPTAPQLQHSRMNAHKLVHLTRGTFFWPRIVMSFNTPPCAPTTTTLRVQNEHVISLRGRAAPTVTDYATWKFNVLLFNAGTKKKKTNPIHFKTLLLCVALKGNVEMCAQN